MNNLNELHTFVVVVEQESFTKAGAVLGVSASAVSHSIKNLEKRLKINLLNRTTRSIHPTEAGEVLYRSLAVKFADIKQCVDDLSQFRNTLQGKLKINANDHAFMFTLWHKFERLMREYPEIELELVSNHRFVDIVAEGFDAGIRLGRDVAKDMIAQRIAPDMQMCVVASPDYWAKHGTPNTPDELTSHRCLRFRLPSTGGIMAWEFVQTDRTESPSSQKFLPQGGFVATSSAFLHHAAKQGAGVIWTPKDSVQTDLDKGILQEVLANYAVSYEGYHLYYPNKRQNSPIFRALIACLKED